MTRNKNTISMAKGIIHASVIPFLIMILINYMFSGNYGILIAVLYIFIVSLAYKKSNKIFARTAFYYTVLAILTFLLLLLSITLSLSI